MMMMMMMMMVVMCVCVCVCVCVNKKYVVLHMILNNTFLSERNFYLQHINLLMKNMKQSYSLFHSYM